MHDISPELIDAMKKTAILVVGDAMLDLYTDGASTRQSPEAPVPVIAADDTRIMLGGAANLAANVAALAGSVMFVGVSGDDAPRAQLTAALQRAGIDASGLIADASRPTVTKHRYLANGIHVARVDHEKTHGIAGVVKDSFVAAVQKALPRVCAVILSDYNKGTLSDEVIADIMKLAKQHNVPVLIDSKKNDWSVFKGAALGKPNRAELEAITKDNNIERAAATLIARSGVAALAVSLAEEGVLLADGAQTYRYPATARAVAEVSGAGDTLLAGMAAALAAGADLRQAVAIGNAAAGLAVARPGTSVVTHKELSDYLVSLNKVKQSA